MMDLIYGPIIKKLDNWIEYMETCPKGMSYADNKEIFDEHRRTHDLDCILTNGNLNADTIISLWTPLKTVIYDNASRNKEIYEVLELKAGNTIYKKIDVLKKIKENIEIILPEDVHTTRLLTRLFILGQKSCNVMILPNRSMNSMRGRNPYKDYMPYFLKECFAGGAFASFFSGDEDFISWIEREKLEAFFEDGVIKPNKIKDLACSGDIKDSKPGDIEAYLRNYESVLESIQEKRTVKNIIAFYENYAVFTNNNMGYTSELVECRYIDSDGNSGLLSEQVAEEMYHIIRRSESWIKYSSCSFNQSIMCIRKDYKEMFEKFRKPGRRYGTIMKMMEEELSLK